MQIQFQKKNMTLIIDPNTEKGKIQLEVLEWAQEQMNKVLEQFFHDNFRIMKGLRLEFKMNVNPDNMTFGGEEKVKVDISELAPNTPDRLKEAIEEVKKRMVFVNPVPKVPSTNATDYPIGKKGEKNGSDKK